MISKENFYSQLNAFEDNSLKFSTCGITSLAMVIQQETGQSVSTDGKLEAFLSKVIKLHRNAGKTAYKKVKLNDKEELITVGPVYKLSKLDKDFIIKDETSDFFPVFNIYTGIDHRGIPKIVEDYQLEAEVRLNYSFDELLEDLRNKKYNYILASIHSLRQRDNHIVVIQSIGTDEKGDYIEFVDPAEKEFDLAIKRQDFKFFEFVFNNRGTGIY